MRSHAFAFALAQFDIKLRWQRRLSQDGALLGNLTRIFVSAVQTLYAEHAARGPPMRRPGR